MIRASVLWVVYACGPQNTQSLAPDEFCALVESLGPEFGGGETVILDCLGERKAHDCADLGAGFLYTDENTVEEASRRCEERDGVPGYGTDVIVASCIGEDGERIDVWNVSCSQPGVL